MEMRLTAGRELDAVVAEKVLGLKVERGWPAYVDHDLGLIAYESREVGVDSGARLFEPVIIAGDLRPFLVDKFSTDIAAVWKVVEKLSLVIMPAPTDWVTPPPWRWCCGQYDINDMYFDEGTFDGHLINFATAETAPLAICLAALKVIGLA